MTHGSLQPQVATWGFLFYPQVFVDCPVGFSKASELSSDELRGRQIFGTDARLLIGPMSSLGYSSARLRPRRAGLCFPQCAEATFESFQHWSPGIRHNISFTPTGASERFASVSARKLGTALAMNDFQDQD
jgi:hypothetical protein